MPIAHDAKLRTLYANLMDEVKVRIYCIDRAANGQTAFPAPIVREFCYLQLRLLCELISLGCLVAHGDIPATFAKQLGKEWSADMIMKSLGKLRPHFYPIPVRQTVFGLGSVRKMHHLDAIQPEPFPKIALIDLYGKTHKHTHRGNVRNLLSSETPIAMNVDYPEIISFAQRINDHLNHHVIAINDKQVILYMLRNAEDGNKVQVAIAEAKIPL